MWISLALIIAAIVLFAIASKQVQAAPTPSHLGVGGYLLYIGSLVGSMYFILRLGVAGVMIVVGRPINQKVAWYSGTHALVHGGTVLAITLAAILFAAPQGFEMLLVALPLALLALLVMGSYANLRETQGWTVVETVAPAPKPLTPAPRPRQRPSPSPRPIVIAPVAPPIIAPPAPRSSAPSHGDEPSLLR